MMNRERKQRNRELLLKIEAMKEMDVRNDVIHKGGLMNQGMNMMNTKKESVLKQEVFFLPFGKTKDIK